MYAAVEHGPVLCSDSNILCLSWKGRVPKSEKEKPVCRRRYYEEGWLATGNGRGVVGVTFTSSHCRRDRNTPQRINFNLRGHNSEVSGLLFPFLSGHRRCLWAPPGMDSWFSDLLPGETSQMWTLSSVCVPRETQFPVACVTSPASLVLLLLWWWAAPWQGLQGGVLTRCEIGWEAPNLPATLQALWSPGSRQSPCPGVRRAVQATGVVLPRSYSSHLCAGCWCHTSRVFLCQR